MLGTVKVDSAFEGGKIEVIEATDPGSIRLALGSDSEAPRFRQWFCFTLRGVRGLSCSISFENAAEATFKGAFDGYDVCASYDGTSWFRVPSRLENGVFRFELKPARSDVTFAYFAPYTASHVAALVRRTKRSRRGEARILGETPLGAPLHLLRFGRLDDVGRSIFVIAQQHPGESMAGWFVEGLVDRLLHGDRIARKVLAEATVSVVPCMNPDGVSLGNHRTNARGLDLNRQWSQPAEGAPEVSLVRKAMQERGVDLFLDVHGDESIPHVFAIGTHGIPSRTERMGELEHRFSAALLASTEDFQTEHGYPRAAPGTAMMGLANSWVGETFGCLALTVEMPFKDHLEHPNSRRGWSPERSKGLGSAFVEAIAETLSELR